MKCQMEIYQMPQGGPGVVQNKTKVQNETKVQKRKHLQQHQTFSTTK